MAQYLVIPDVTEAEDLVSFSHASDHSFDVVLNVGNTATWLFNAASTSALVPLIAIMADSMTIALDDVFVSAAQVGAGPDPHVAFSFNASGVRFI